MLWSALEADFQREYHIDLNASLNSMSWRRFLVLVGNLSASSSLVAALQNRSDGVISDPKAAERALSGLWG